jgi:hypothetical protein
MFFKNKETGLTWEVVHPDHIKRCKNDVKYEEVKKQPKKPAKEVTEKKVAPKKTTRSTTPKNK